MKMEVEDVHLPTQCSIISIPSKFMQVTSTFESLSKHDPNLLTGLGPNTIVINKETCTSIGLNCNEYKPILWVELRFLLKFSVPVPKSVKCLRKRVVQIIIDNRVKCTSVVASDDFFHNLYYSVDIRPENLTPIKLQELVLSSDDNTLNMNQPRKAKKVIISLLQCGSFLKNSFVDQQLLMYFSYPRYLLVNDVFGVYIDESYKLDLTNNTIVDVIYFKVCEIEGESQQTDSKSMGFLVDSTVKLYQVSHYQDFLPPRKISPYYKQNLSSLLLDRKLLNNLKTYNQHLVPMSFNKLFKTLCSWIEPIVFKSNKMQGIKLSPVFLLSGQNGTGKSFILKALSDYFGINYWRIDCVNVGGTISSQAEAKLKVVFNQLKSFAPCILHLSNFEALCHDADLKDDVRVLKCFEEQVKKLDSKWPVFIVGTTQSMQSISPKISYLFLDSVNIGMPDYDERESILSWFCQCNGSSIDTEVLRSISSQTSGFAFRDLEVIVAFAFKEKYKRSKEMNTPDIDFNVNDFSKILGIMRKAFSDSIGAPKVPSVSWKDVGGLESLKKEILRSLRSNLFNTGLKRSGLLLHGPPGTGKTLLAKAVATQCNRNFLSVKGPELLNMYVGQSEQNVRDLFQLAKAASPCLIFFDELDSLAPNRGRSGDSGGVMDRVVSQLLAEMDDLCNSGDVFILGATNRPDLIDPALLRPGRLDKLLYIGPCDDRGSQLSVLSALTRKLCLEPDVNLEEIVCQLPTSVSGAQLSALCSAAWLSSARQSILNNEHSVKKVVIVQQTHFISALKEIFK